MPIARGFPRSFSRPSVAIALLAGVAGAREPRGGVARSGSAHREVTRTGPNGNAQTWQRDTTLAARERRVRPPHHVDGPGGRHPQQGRPRRAHRDGSHA